MKASYTLQKHSIYSKSYKQLTLWCQGRQCSWSEAAEECDEQHHHCSCRNEEDGSRSSCFLHRSCGRHRLQVHLSSTLSSPWTLLKREQLSISDTTSFIQRCKLYIHTGSDVVPVRVIRSKLLEFTSLHYVGPRWQLNLASKGTINRK